MTSGAILVVQIGRNRHHHDQKRTGTPALSGTMAIMRTRRRWSAVFVALMLVAGAGCGGGGGDSSLDEPAEDVARLQPGDRPVRFRLDTDVPDDVQRFVVETLGWAHTDLGDS